MSIATAESTGPKTGADGAMASRAAPIRLPEPIPDPLYQHSPVFQMALKQLWTVAENFDIDPGVLERLSKPKRAVIVSVPVRMDSGITGNFIGFRVQHSLTSGPAKGGLR